jgi:hypothetical protein
MSSTGGAAGSNLPPEKIINTANQLFNISKSESIAVEKVPDDITQKLEEKQKLEEQIKEAEAVLQSKNVSIDAILTYDIRIRKCFSDHIFPLFYHIIRANYKGNITIDYTTRQNA